MRRLTISTSLAGIVGALILALLLFSGGPSAKAVTGPTPDPTTGSIGSVQIDMNNTGNAPGTGTDQLQISQIIFGSPNTTIKTVGNHGWASGNTVTIAGSNSTPTINGSFPITVTATNTFTVPTATTASGPVCSPLPTCPGTVTRTTPHNSLSTIENSSGNVPVSSILPIDVIVDEIAPADGPITDWGFNLHFGSPLVASVNGHTNFMVNPGGSEPVTCNDPDNTGNWRCDFLTNGAGSHVGEGILAEVGIQCDTIGSSTLFLGDDPPVGDGTPDIFTDRNTNGDPTNPMPVGNWTGKPGLGGLPKATIYCGMNPPALTNLQVVPGSVVTTVLGSPTPGVNFSVTVDAQIKNTGPGTPVNSDTNEVLVETDTGTLLNDCTITGPSPANPFVVSLAFPAAATTVPTRTFTVNCAHTSLHHFQSTATISIDASDAANYSDTNSGDDSGTSPVVAKAVTATTDIAIVGATTSSGSPSQCLPASPPAPGCATAPVVTMNTPQTITIKKTLLVVGGYNGGVPVDDTVTFGGAGTTAGVGAVEAPGNTQKITAVSVAASAEITTASTHGYLTGDSITIVGSNSTPTVDGTYVITVTATNKFTVPVTTTVAGTAAGTTTINPMPSPTPCVLTSATSCTWQPYSSPSGLPVTTCSVAGTGSQMQSTILFAAPVTLTFTFTVTCTVDSFFDSHHPQQVIILWHDDAVVNDPTTHISETVTTNNHSGAFGPFTNTTNCGTAPSCGFWSRNTFNPSFLWTIDSTDTANATADPASIPSTHNCLTNSNHNPNPTIALTGLPCEMYTLSDVPPGDALGLAAVLTPRHSIVGTGSPSKGFEIAPSAIVPNGTAVAYFGFSVNVDFGSGCVVPITSLYPNVRLVDGELPDGSTLGDPPSFGGVGPDDGTAAALSNPAVWPTRLNSDPLLQVISGGGALLWTRMTGSAPGLGTPVNVLTFNAGSYYVNLAISSDPTVATPPGSQCTPLHTEADYLGKVSAVLDIASISSAGVVTTQTTHNFSSGDSVTIAASNAASPSCNGVFVITVTGPKTFTIACTPATPGSALGTATDTTKQTSGTQILRQCDDVSSGFTPDANGMPGLGSKYWFVAKFTRGDDYESTTLIDKTNSCTASDTAVTLVKNDTLGAPVPPASNEIDGGITYTQNVQYNITGSGSTLTLSLLGPSVCNPHWTNPLDSFPNNAGGTQTSVVTIGPNAVSGTATYSFNCPPGDYTFQIIANLTSGPGETNTSNNQFENHVTVHVVTDIDHDGVPNNTDQCPTVAEDPDGVQDSDGCPDTNVSVTAVKEENYNVDVSTDVPLKNVTITVTNGNFPANVTVNITAISQIGQCEVRLVPHAGDTYSEYFTDEDGVLNGGNDAPNETPDTLTSQVSFVISNMPANSTNTYQYTYSIHCFHKSFHPQAFELQVDALPVAPVVEENLGTAQFPCGGGIPGNHGPNDNVTKNCPNVTALDNADLMKSGCVTTSPVTVAVNVAFFVSQTCTIKNNGPVGADYTDTAILSGPFAPAVGADCTVAVATPLTQSSSAHLNSGQQANVGIQWTVTCTGYSNHTFVVNDTVSINQTADMLHVKDPNPNNNTGTSSSVTHITAVTDVSVSAGNPNCLPNAAQVGTIVTCTEHDTVILGLASSATLTGTLSVSDCTITSTNPVTQAAVNGDNVMTWTIVCNGPSDHTVTKNVSITPTFPVHVSETNTANNSGIGNSVVKVLLNASLSATITGVPAEIDITGTTTTIHPVVDITSVPSPIGIDWTVSYTTTCTGAPGNVTTSGTTPVHATLTATLTVPTNAHECSVTICVNAHATDLHTSGSLTQTCTISKIESDVLIVKYVILVGPAAVNLSDTNGRYMWVIAEIGNLSSDAELVHINISIAPPMPASNPATPACTRDVSQILPGAAQFMLGSVAHPHEQKVLVWRVRYECHAPVGGAQVINQSVTVGVTHCDTTTTGPATTEPPSNPSTPTAPGGKCQPNAETGTAANGDVESFVSDNTVTQTKQVILQ